jgi:hypothetical protein
MIDQIPTYDFVGRVARCHTDPVLILHPVWEDDVKAHGWRYERFTMDTGGEGLRVYVNEPAGSAKAT